MATYDFTDPQVAKMVEQSHTPVEMPAKAQGAAAPGEALKPIPLLVVCAMDREPWPCAAVVALREFKKPQPLPPSSSTLG